MEIKTKGVSGGGLKVGKESTTLKTTVKNRFDAGNEGSV